MKTLICIQFLFTSIILAEDNLWDKMKSKAKEYFPIDKEEIRECPINKSLIYKVNIEIPSVSNRERAAWITYKNIKYDKENQNIKITDTSDFNAFDLLLKKRFIGSSEYQCKVIG